MAEKLPFVNDYVDRHGKRRYKFRRKGYKTRSLPGRPGQKQFNDAYAAACAQAPIPEATAPEKLGAPNRDWTFAQLVDLYYQSSKWTQIQDSTKSSYRSVINYCVDTLGEFRVRAIKPRHIVALMEKKAGTGAIAQANNIRKRLRPIAKMAVLHEIVDADFMVGVDPLRHETLGFHAWTEEEVRRFEDRHPVGSQARLAFELLLCTGQRRSDIVKMGRQHVIAAADGFPARISIVQQKTGSRATIVLHERLRKVLDAVPKDQLTFLITSFGKPYVAAGFGNWFREMCDAAGLNHCSAHGLRKAATRRLAEVGCTEDEMMAITGHKTSSELQLYKQAADRNILSLRAHRKQSGRTGTEQESD